MNVLILSCGTRNKIVQYFKKSITSKVVATDMSDKAPALYDADTYYVVPSINDSNYIDTILDICKKEDINCVLSLIDPELSLLAINSKKFESINVKVIGSSYELCEMALDKMEMYNWFTIHNYLCAKSYDKLEPFLEDLKNNKISFPVFVKPIKGSASINISKVNDIETLRFVFNKYDGLMIQELLNGIEIGADVYIDMISKEVVSIFTKKKLLMRSGETDKAISFIDDKLNKLIEKFVTDSGFLGQIDIDIFEINGNYYISEVNPRFGGGYPHAYECGCDHMKLIANNVNGIINEKNIGKYEENVVMMKYNEVKICKF